MSCTVMIWSQVATLPHGSVAVQVRVTVLVCGQSPGVSTSFQVIPTVPLLKPACA